jgi:hypothetical protein
MRRLGLIFGLLAIFLTSTLSVRAQSPAAAHDAGAAACKFITGNQTECTSCFDNGGAWTALGCIGAGGNPSDFVASVIQIGVGMGGGIAFLLILFAGIQTMMSAGNPEKLHAARELMGAAISGLLLIVFSVFLLKLIGVDILGIPTLSGADPFGGGAPFR